MLAVLGTLANSVALPAGSTFISLLTLINVTNSEPSAAWQMFSLPSTVPRLATVLILGSMFSNVTAGAAGAAGAAPAAGAPAAGAPAAGGAAGAWANAAVANAETPTSASAVSECFMTFIVFLLRAVTLSARLCGCYVDSRVPKLVASCGHVQL